MEGITVCIILLPQYLSCNYVCVNFGFLWRVVSEKIWELMKALDFFLRHWTIWATSLVFQQFYTEKRTNNKIGWKVCDNYDSSMYFLPALICTYSNILKEYKLAQFHCYGRYLAKHVQRNLTLSETAELDADKFYKMHLPNGLDNLASATMVVSETLV